MHKKKILSGAAVVLGLSLVGGSLAWFTDSSSVLNNFKALNVKAEIVQQSGESGVKQMVPGDTIKKDVDIKVNSSAETFVRVKITKGWKNGESIYTSLSADNIQLNYTEGVKSDIDISNISEITQIEDNKWVDGKDGYLYYIGIVKAVEEDATTLHLLDSVTFVPTVPIVPTDEDNSTSVNVDNEYQDKEMYVNVKLEAIQAKNNAFETGWRINSKSKLGEKLAELSASVTE